MGWYEELSQANREFVDAARSDYENMGKERRSEIEQMAVVYCANVTQGEISYDWVTAGRLSGTADMMLTMLSLISGSQTGIGLILEGGAARELINDVAHAVVFAFDHAEEMMERVQRQRKAGTIFPAHTAPPPSRTGFELTSEK